jgi:protein phosphatase
MQLPAAPIKVPDSGRAQHLHFVAVGDSRAYLIRGGAIERLTVDDTWPDKLFHLGQITADQAKHHHMRNMLMSALGMSDFHSDQKEIRAVDVYDGDRYLLASDGLTDVVDDDQLLAIVNENHNPQVAAERLTQRAIANDAGDDVTCVLFYVQSDLDREPPVPPIPTMWKRLASLFKPR